MFNPEIKMADPFRKEYSICICTYKRPKLLQLLLLDISLQTRQPDEIFIIDGAPEISQAREVLLAFSSQKFLYVPSNYANIAYQRYLGWKAAAINEVEVLVYLDDDIRIDQKNALEILISPLVEKGHLVGTTAPITFQDLKNLHEASKSRGFIETFSIWRDAHIPGSITPVGVRLLPKEISRGETGRVKWAYGGVMAFDMKYLTVDSFLETSFALNHIGCGLGEDTLISHIASFKGDIGLVTQAEFLHPNADSSVAYSREGFAFGYATAYSRRLINDHYRQKPLLRDRLYLFTSYIINNFMNIKNILTVRKKYHLRYFWGYFLGSVRGILQKPAAKQLTPDIDWFQDAEKAMAKAEEIH